ncbi:MAG: caspase family protein [Nitrospinae bacterium]|nr:caspase family protein [Nitrospinota bacterium]
MPTAADLSLAFSPDGKYLLIGGMGGDLALRDATSGKVVRELKGHSGFGLGGAVQSVEFSPDGKYALSGGGDGTARLWDISTGENIKTFKHPSEVISALFMPGSRQIICGDKDGNIKLWDIGTGENIKTLKEEEEVFSMAVSPDGKQVFAATQHEHSILLAPLEAAAGAMQEKKVSSWDIASGKRLQEYTFQIPKAIQSIVHIALSPDGKRLFIAGDASLRIMDVLTWKEIAMTIAYEDGEWLVITSEGYYNSSEKGAQYLNVKVGETSYSVDSFYDVFYRPDIVTAKLRGEDIKDLVTITMKDAIKSPPPLVEISPVTTSPSSPKAKVCYNIKSTGGGIGEVRLFHNGKLIESDGYYKEAAKTVTEKTRLAKLDSKAIYEDMRSVKIKEKTEISPVTTKTKGEAFNDCKEIEAISGENEISITAFNKDNTVQSYMQTAKFNSQIKPEEPHLYILSIGIDQYRDSTINLKYAVKDSTDIKERLIRQASTLYKPQNIHNIMLKDSEATKDNILGRIGELSKQIKPTDSFILFAAGHGVLLQNQYYMLTHDFDGNVSENNLVSSNEIVEMSKKIKSLNQLFIFDTCHAGGVDYIVSGLYDARMSVLAKKMGLHIYASANDKQSALDGYQGNGLFTYTLLDGLNNKKEADKNQDRQISLIELGEYSKLTTTDISKKIGHAQTPLIINFGKDNPVYNLR